MNKILIIPFTKVIIPINKLLVVAPKSIKYTIINKDTRTNKGGKNLF